MTRAREDVNIQNIKSLNRGTRTTYESPKQGNENKIQKVQMGEQEMVQKTKSPKQGNERQDANSYRSLPGDVGRNLDQRFQKRC